MTQARSRRSLIAGGIALLAVGVLVGSCSIQPDGAPRDIPEDHPALLAAADEDLAAGGEARGTDRIFLLSPDGDGTLRTVRRDTNHDPEQLLRALIQGPNATEFREGFRSNIPRDLEIHDVRVDAGVVQIDLSDDILDARLSGTELTRAIAQIVYTASEIDGATSVLIRVDGAARAWPNGSQQEQRGPLTVYDFLGYAESAQPPYPATPTATTTATTAPPTTAAPAEPTTVPTTAASTAAAGSSPTS